MRRWEILVDGHLRECELRGLSAATPAAGFENGDQGRAQPLQVKKGTLHRKGQSGRQNIAAVIFHEAS